MDLQIALLLGQDGITNGAIYALLSLALVLVFTVTRVIFIPQGEFVAFGALTLASFQAGKTPGTLWLLIGAGVLVAVVDITLALRSRCATADSSHRRLESGLSSGRCGRGVSVEAKRVSAAGPDCSCLGAGGTARTHDVSAGVSAAGRGQCTGAADCFSGCASGIGRVWGCCSSAPRVRVRRLFRTQASIWVR